MSLQKICSHPFTIALLHVTFIFVLPVLLDSLFGERVGAEKAMVSFFGIIILAILFGIIFDVIHFKIFGVMMSYSHKKQAFWYFLVALLPLSYLSQFYFSGVDVFLFFFLEFVAIIIMTGRTFTHQGLEGMGIFLGTDTFNYKKILRSTREGLIDVPFRAGGIGCVGFTQLLYGHPKKITAWWDMVYSSLTTNRTSQERGYIREEYDSGMIVGWVVSDEFTQNVKFIETKGALYQSVQVLQVTAVNDTSEEDENLDPQVIIVKGESNEQQVQFITHSFKKKHPYKKGITVRTNIVGQGDHAYVHEKKFYEKKPKQWQIEALRFKKYPETFIADTDNASVWLRGKIIAIEPLKNKLSHEAVYRLQLFINKSFVFEVFINEIALLGKPKKDCFVEGRFLLTGNT